MYQRGDVVQLASNGRIMTFLKIDSQGKAICTWGGQDQVRIEKYDLADLKRWVPTAGPHTIPQEQSA